MNFADVGDRYDQERATGRTGSVPIVTVAGRRIECSTADGKSALHSFCGVAYYADRDCFVYTVATATGRSMWELGSRSIAGATAEAEVIKSQSSLF